ncbi:hypothetical protein SADUNF_Sadunf16G0213200 [Salix dunnii]|uniref:dTMP kinase n=1 Tax=Salix dunnii TaxID=1413687 RepID=A0A835JFJ5_9ROSI|nr:hypothetical protein SADUNF_Sadunf16G0213200 [Salix dunnii]
MPALLPRVCIRNLRALTARRLLSFGLDHPNKCCISSVRMGSSSNCNLRASSSESRGALIVLEGLDRSGKTSQSSRLLSYLEGLGHSTELWRFPDRSTSVGQMISAYLSNKSHLDDRTIHLLFSANRWEKRVTVEVSLYKNFDYQKFQDSNELFSRSDGFTQISLMETQLKNGITLIIDRYSYSGVAFSSAKGLDIEWCKAPEVGLLAPDIVLYLDIPPEKAAERGGYGGERYEQLEFQRKVAKCYQAQCDSSWKVIDACQPIEDIEKQLQDAVLDHVTDVCQPIEDIDKQMHFSFSYTALKGSISLSDLLKHTVWKLRIHVDN